MKILILIGGIALAALLSLTKDEMRLPNWEQCRQGNMKSNPCPVSFYSIIENPELYDGKYVKFIGYYPSSGARIIYINKDAAISGDFMSSLLMDTAHEKTCGYYQARGLFRHETKDSGLAPGIYMSYGVMDETTLSRPPHAIKHGCDLDDDSIVYLNGVVPIRRGN